MTCVCHNRFDENYALASTQSLKNKDIPEGGAKGTILPSYVIYKLKSPFSDQVFLGLERTLDVHSRNTSMLVIFAPYSQRSLYLRQWFARRLSSTSWSRDRRLELRSASLIFITSPSCFSSDPMVTSFIPAVYQSLTIYSEGTADMMDWAAREFQVTLTLCSWADLF